jgi:glycosyltransferase involved in cell wall biosynthesis
MKSLIVSASFPTKGKEAGPPFVYDEAFELSRKNVEVHVVKFSSGKVVCSNAMFVHNAMKPVFWNLPFAMLNALMFPRSFLSHPKPVIGLSVYGKGIANIAKKYDIQILHAHFAWPSGFAALLAKREVNKPLLVTLHGVDILIDASIAYGARLHKHINEAVRKVLKFADRVIVASKYVYEEALKAGCSRSNLVYLPNGIDINRFNLNLEGSKIRKYLNIKDDDPVIFTVRAHVPKNGIEYLVKASTAILKKFRNAKFIIGGRGPLQEYHKFLARKLRVSENIIFAGYIPESQLPHYYAASDVFVIPSVIEAFGLVTAEAMACGKAVIGSDVGGIPDTIIDGVNGFLVKPKEPKDLADKILYLIGHPEVARKMGKAGRKIAEEKFDIEKRIEKIVQLYSRLV